MATLHPLLFSFLFTALWAVVGSGNGAIANFHVDERDAVYTAKDLSDTRMQIIGIATAEIGVRELTGKNDGERVEEYLSYTDLGKGYAWCAAFVSWCCGKAGQPQPRNPWSPALFPNTRTYCKRGVCHKADIQKQIKRADIFGIYGVTAKRIHHVGIIREIKGRYIVTVEGNSNDKVESRRRHLSTVYALSNWLKD